MLLAAGCHSSVKSSVDHDPEIRQSALDGARASCVQSAESKLGTHPELRPKIVSYCDCFATKGLGRFSNSEIVSVGLKGINSLTPEQHAKLNDAVKTCETQVGIR